MNKLMTVALLAVLMTACGDKSAEAPAADVAPATDATEAAPADAAVEESADAAAVDTSVGAGLPAACEEYLTRAKACFAKTGGGASAAAFQQGVDQAREQWEALPDKSGLDTACAAANDQFAQTAAMLNCE
ncbi:DUF5339 family protein [Pseudoxanthomonas koreensis]|uniref:DUF5339 family protein n=1 Tax=Pseudoxanthomonas koreensis TaxID=266061 RepID=UPI0035A71C41